MGMATNEAYLQCTNIWITKTTPVTHPEAACFCLYFIRREREGSLSLGGPRGSLAGGSTSLGVRGRGLLLTLQSGYHSDMRNLLSRDYDKLRQT